MTQLTSLSPQQLRKAADLQEKILKLQNDLNELLGTETVAVEAPSAPTKKRKKLSRQGIANIRAGVAKRMAKQGAKVATATPAGKPQRSAAWRKALSAALKARWAARRAAGKARL
jgi:hypothetical protein